MNDTRRYLTPPALAEQLGVSPEKVIGFIRSGELRAVDVSHVAGVGRPRWRISPEAVVEWEARRGATPPVKRGRRNRRPAGILDIIR